MPVVKRYEGKEEVSPTITKEKPIISIRKPRPSDKKLIALITDLITNRKLTHLNVSYETVSYDYVAEGVDLVETVEWYLENYGTKEK